MPEVVATQAHTMADFFRARPDLWNVIEGDLHELQPGKFFTVLNRTADKDLMLVYEGLVKSICYPEWNPNTFQVGKNDHALYVREEDFWILNQNIKRVKLSNTIVIGNFDRPKSLEANLSFRYNNSVSF